MKKIKSILKISILLIILLSTAIVVKAVPEDRQISLISESPEENVQIPETISNDVYKMEEKTNLTENIEGNVFVFSQEAYIKSEYIYGSLFVIAPNIEIDASTITGNLFLIGENITIKNSAYISDIYAIANTFNLDETSMINRDLKICASNINLSGTIYRDVYVAGNTLNLNDTAVIMGNLKYSTETEQVINSDSIYGEVEFHKLNTVEPKNENVVKTIAIEVLSSIVLVLVLYVVFKYKAPNILENFKNKDIKDYLLYILKGLIAIFVIPIISMILMITVIGFPIGIILLTSYIVLMFIAYAIAIISIVPKIKLEINDFIELIIVVIAFMALLKIPVVSTIVSILFVLLGTGVVISLLLNKKEKNNEKIEENTKNENNEQ